VEVVLVVKDPIHLLDHGQLDMVLLVVVAMV